MVKPTCQLWGGLRHAKSEAGLPCMVCATCAWVGVGVSVGRGVGVGGGVGQCG